MKKITFPLLASLAWGLFLQGCSPSSESPGSDSRSGSGTGTSSGSAPEGAVELKIKWPVGNRYVQRMELKRKISIYFPRRPEPLSEDVVMVQEWAISVLPERESAGRQLELEHLSVSLDAARNNQPEISLNSAGESADGPDDPQGALIRNMVGTRRKLLLDETDHLESVEGLDEFLKKIVQTSPPGSRVIMTNLFGKETFQRIVEFSQGMPTHPVQPGDSWSSTNEISAIGMGKLVSKLDYTFEKWEIRETRTCALLRFTGAIESAGDGGTGPMGLRMQLQKGSMTGRSWFDPELGISVESEVEQDMKMLTTANTPRVGDKGGGAQTLKTDVKQRIHIKLTEFSVN